MELACKALVDDDHGRTRIKWIIPDRDDSASARTAPYESKPGAAPAADVSTPPLALTRPGFAPQSALYDFAALDDLGPVRAARVMLRSAAEVEHQLFLQYLYASSSLKDPLAARIVADIAVEEMGHLLTVNNLLIALDGDPYFGRGPDVPSSPSPDPFAFRLRAGSQGTLAMFTAAESPNPKTLSSWFARRELWRIFRVADAPLQFHPVQRVGKLYQHIVSLMKKNHDELDDTFVKAAQYLPLQANPAEEWSHAGVSRHMIVEQVTNRHQAILALTKIMTQGEGFFDDKKSHFARFRRIYRGMRLPRVCPFVFKDLNLSTGAPTMWLHGLWRALGLYWPDFAAVEPDLGAVVANPPTLSQLLARLLNSRYQLLLVRLYLIFAPNPGPQRNIRIDCALREMRFVLAPLTDGIRQHIAPGEACPELYALPPYFDPHIRPDQLALQASLLSDTQSLLEELSATAPSSGLIKSIAAAVRDLETALEKLSGATHE